MSDSTRSALETFFESLEGYQLPGFEKGMAYKCDFCSGTIHPRKKGHESPDARVSHYLTSELLNDEWVPDDPAPFSILRTYCPDCDRNRIQWPCKGWNELLVSSNFRPDGTVDDFELEDFSSKDDGEPWDPKEVWEAVHNILIPGVTFEEWMKMNMMDDTMDRAAQNPERHAMGFGPEDIIDGLLAWEVDPREITDDEGNVVMDDEKEEELRAHLEKRVEEFGPAITDEAHWNDMVTRNR